MQYFINRSDKTYGPFTGNQIKAGVSAGKINDTDMISNSKEGPWKTFAMFSNEAPDVTNPENSRTNDCSDCGGLMSVQVSACPHCGAPVSVDDIKATGNKSFWEEMKEAGRKLKKNGQDLVEALDDLSQANMELADELNKGAEQLNQGAEWLKKQSGKNETGESKAD